MASFLPLCILKTIMKILLFLFLPFFLLSQETSSKQVNWLYNYEEAVDSSSKEGKNVLIYFTGSDWCPPCIKLKQDLFDTDDFVGLSKDFILLYIDIPRNRDLLSEKQWKHNQTIFEKYNDKKSFPLFVVLNQKQKIKDKYSGYSMNGAIDHHLQFLRKNK